MLEVLEDGKLISIAESETKNEWKTDKGTNRPKKVPISNDKSDIQHQIYPRHQKKIKLSDAAVKSMYDNIRASECWFADVSSASLSLVLKRSTETTGSQLRQENLNKVAFLP